MRHGLMLAPFGELADPRVVADLAADGERAGGAGLGVNTGGELTRFGEEDDARLRGDRLDEGLELLCRLWSGEEVTHRGPHFTAEGVRFEPRPLQRPRIPIWVAAPSGKPRPLRRAVRYDGICTDIGPAGAPALLERLREERGGLDGFDVVVMGEPGADSSGWERAGATWWIVDFPDPVDLGTVAGLIADGPR